MRLRKRSDLGTTAWVASIQPFVRLESIDLAAFCAASDRNRPEVWAKHGQGRSGQRQGGVEMAERRHQTSGYETVAEKNPSFKGGRVRSSLQQSGNRSHVANAGLSRVNPSGSVTLPGGSAGKGADVCGRHWF